MIDSLLTSAVQKIRDGRKNSISAYRRCSAPSKVRVKAR